MSCAGCRADQSKFSAENYVCILKEANFIFAYYMDTKNKIIVILGQTSTGKSDFAVEMAKKISGLNQSKRLIARTSQSEALGEIVSADSRQVYKGMDLGTGKITKKEMKGIPHYLLDIVSPSKVFTVNDFQKLANKEISKIHKKNKIPIICGGTGFYIDAVVNGTIFPEVPPNEKLRKKLYSKSAIALFEYLEKIDKERAKTIDKNNKVRLVRAIEIAKALGKVPSQKLGLGLETFEVLKIGLKIPDEILKERIKKRLLSRIKKGMIKEVLSLHEDKKISWKRLESFGLEYKYVSHYLQKIKNLPNLILEKEKREMIEKLNTEIWHFAKRQNTWFKRDPNIIWINPLSKSDKSKTLKEIKKFLSIRQNRGNNT